ncbi:MAG: winged helix-turn-helix domain-containing protein [Betaproteobacteria bacterium]
MSTEIENRGAPAKDQIHIGDWIVEPTLNRLSSAGETVKVEPKAMSVLVHLADRAGEVVSREALLSAVWPNVVVGDDSLTQVVIKLRKALGDVPDKPVYIETIAKRGYRLIAPVIKVGTIPPAQVRPNSVTPQVERRRISWIAVSGVAALLATAAGVWWILDGPKAVSSSPIASIEAARSAKPVVSVRPFEALTDDAQTTLLARGLTEDLVTDLSKADGLQVISVAAVAEQGGAAAPAETASGYLVTGSVQRVDERLRLRIHLTETVTGKSLWSERFDRGMADFFAIQDELGSKLLQILPAKVSEAELRRVAHRYTHNLEAYEYFQRGQTALLVRQQADNATAREMFRRAIALDAAFARAYAGLALTYAADYRNHWTADGAVALDRAFEIAQTAHQINPDIRETYWVLAFVHVERRQHTEAIQYLETAVRLSPSFADGYALLGGVYTYIGRPSDTLPLLRTAMRLDPQPGYLYFLLLGRAYLFLGDLEQARANLDHALSRNPVNLETHIYLAATHVLADDKAKAAWEVEEIRALQPGFSARGWLETYPMTDATQTSRLANALGSLGF